MAKDRANVNFGPALMTLTGTTATVEVSAWQHLGPVKGSNTQARVTWSATSAGNQVKVEAIWHGGRGDTLSTVTTAVTGSVNLVTRTSTQTAAIASTNALLYNWFRLRSTGLVTSVVATVHYGGLA